MRFAYADPPYIGMAKKYLENTEVDHIELIQQLVSGFPDGWALSCYTNSLHIILPLCPREVRIAAWVKPFCSFKKGVRPAYAWEPVLFCGGRNPSRGFRAAVPTSRRAGLVTPRDWHSASSTLKKGLCGAKPESFCRWVLDLLNVQPGDEVVDLYPGTGVMGRAAAEVTQHVL